MFRKKKYSVCFHKVLKQDLDLVLIGMTEMSSQQRETPDFALSGTGVLRRRHAQTDRRSMGELVNWFVSQQDYVNLTVLDLFNPVSQSTHPS